MKNPSSNVSKLKRYFLKKCVFIKSISYEILYTIKQTLFTSVFSKGLILVLVITNRLIRKCTSAIKISLRVF